MSLRKGDELIAVEICSTTSPHHEATNLAKRIEAGCTQAISLTTDPATRELIWGRIQEDHGEDTSSRIECLTVEGLGDYLENLEESEGQTTTIVKGWTVTRTMSELSLEERDKRRAKIARLAAEVLRRFKK